MRNVVKASVCGVVITLMLLAGAFAADAFAHQDLARALFWQNSLLQQLAPPNNIGTLQKPIYEGTPLNLLAFLASIPFGFIIYGVIAYAALRVQRRGT
jgi:hypothetical protein